MQDIHVEIKNFIDTDGKITGLPAKRRPRIFVLAYLAEKFETGKTYTEKQVNEIIDHWHSFNDYFILRRELFDKGFLGRQRDGSEYWREDGPDLDKV